MNLRTLLIATCLGLCFALPASARNRPDDPRPEVQALSGHTIAELYWLSEHWVAEGDGPYVESWFSEADTESMIGMARCSVDNNLIFTEVLLIREFPEGISLTYRLMNPDLAQEKDEVVSMVMTAFDPDKKTVTFSATDEMGDLRSITWHRDGDILASTIVDDSGEKPVEQKLDFTLENPCAGDDEPGM